MNFGDALGKLREGHRIAREGWNGKGMWLWLVSSWDGDIATSPNPFDYFETLPFIAMKTADDKLVPWLASQTDMLAGDWQVVV